MKTRAAGSFALLLTSLGLFTAFSGRSRAEPRVAAGTIEPETGPSVRDEVSSQASSSGDIVRVTLSLLVIGLLILACLRVIQPFAPAMTWSAMVVVATWPMLITLQARLGGRRGPAVCVMTLGMLVVLVLPLVLAITAIATQAEGLAARTREVLNEGLPGPGAWVERIPLVGEWISQQWTVLAESSQEDLASRAAPFAGKAFEWFVDQVGNVGRILLHVLLTVVITAIFYATGERAAAGVRRFARRLAGEQGDGSVLLAGRAIRAVALGVVVTALVQSLAAGIGLAVCRVPFAVVLTGIAFVLCIAQLGAIPILLPAAGWLFWSGRPGWGTVLLVWTAAVSMLDNVLRPMLIRRGADLPLLLTFVGVIGGLASLGIIGLFVGPVVLAVTYRLLGSWTAGVDLPPATAVAAPGTERPAT